MASKNKPMPYQFELIPWRDSKNRNWLLENIEDLEALKKIKEAMPLQFFPESDRTKKQMTGVYEKLNNATDFESVKKIVFSAFNWFCNPEFKTIAFTKLLEDKLPLAQNEREEKFLTLCVAAMKKHGAIPKKIKMCFTAEEKDEE